jgi:DNA-directed RNA polymerase specialized sigma24 family protein
MPTDPELDRTNQLLDEIVRLLALPIRKGAENQTEAISLLSDAGLEANRIAELVGTSAATVRSAQARARTK